MDVSTTQLFEEPMLLLLSRAELDPDVCRRKLSNVDGVSKNKCETGYNCESRLVVADRGFSTRTKLKNGLGNQ